MANNYSKRFTEKLGGLNPIRNPPGQQRKNIFILYSSSRCCCVHMKHLPSDYSTDFFLSFCATSLSNSQNNRMSAVNKIKCSPPRCECCRFTSRRADVSCVHRSSLSTRRAEAQTQDNCSSNICHGVWIWTQAQTTENVEHIYYNRPERILRVQQREGGEVSKKRGVFWGRWGLGQAVEAAGE